MPVYESDLDEHIQDRLRAAEEMAEAIRRGPCEACPYSHAPKEAACGDEQLDRALAAYEATFQEADT